MELRVTKIDYYDRARYMFEASLKTVLNSMAFQITMYTHEWNILASK